MCRQIIATALLAGLLGMASAAAIAEDKLLALNLTGKLDMLEKLADEKTALKEKAMGTFTDAMKEVDNKVETVEAKLDALKDCKPGDTYIYGVADNNLIYEVNPDRQSARSVLDVSAFLGSNPNPNANKFNSFAFDRQHDTFYFMNGDENIYAWVRSSGAVGQVAPKQSIGRFNPANAVYYDGAYWFINYTSKNVTNVTLSRVAMTPSAIAGDLPTFAGTTTYSVSLKTTGGAPFTILNGYGDIAVSAAGDMYISSLNFVGGTTNTAPLLVIKDLAGAVAGGNITATTIVETGLNQQQLSFDCAGRALWGQTYAGCEWSTFDLATGARTPRFTLSLPGAADPNACLRDLGGAACTCALLA